LILNIEYLVISLVIYDPCLIIGLSKKVTGINPCLTILLMGFIYSV